MKKDTARVYVTVGRVFWDIYKIWIEKGSLYYTFSPQQGGFNTKTTYHPIEKQKWGLIHTKKNELGTRSHEQGRMTAKTRWPGFKELEIVPIDSGALTLEEIREAEKALLVRATEDHPK